MALFMTLLIRDEEDILDANLRYHFENGVDHVIVTDNLSVDHSVEILKPYLDQGLVTYVYEPDNTYAQSKWVSRMAAMAHEAGANWVMHCDADEFWVAPAEKSLKHWFSRQLWPNIVFAPRHDFVCIEDDGNPFWQRMIYRKARSTNPLGQPLPPKVAHRTAPNLEVAQGNHSVKGFRWPRRKESDLEILHFPLRSREQYIRKIENGGKAYANNTELDQSVGFTWRKQYTELQETGTLAFVEENIVSPEALAVQMTEGIVIQDKRLATFFEAQG